MIVLSVVVVVVVVDNIYVIIKIKEDINKKQYDGDEKVSLRFFNNIS
jgi:hypothetical protein